MVIRKNGFWSRAIKIQTIIQTNRPDAEGVRYATAVQRTHPGLRPPLSSFREGPDCRGFLIIEANDPIHEKTQAYDQLRTVILNQTGYPVLRLKSEEILANISNIRASINSAREPLSETREGWPEARVSSPTDGNKRLFLGTLSPSPCQGATPPLESPVRFQLVACAPQTGRAKDNRILCPAGGLVHLAQNMVFLSGGSMAA